MKQHLEGLTKGIRPILLFFTIIGLTGGIGAVIAGVHASNHWAVLVGGALALYSIIVTIKYYPEMGLDEQVEKQVKR